MWGMDDTVVLEKPKDPSGVVCNHTEQSEVTTRVYGLEVFIIMWKTDSAKVCTDTETGNETQKILCTKKIWKNRVK